jgi:enolase
MPTVRTIDGLEILDSRGRPTVQATCVLASGASGTVSVPSGASTGSAEAHELRDGDRGRYDGLGCRKAVAHIRGALTAELVGRDYANQGTFDQALIAADGTSDKSRYGGNTLLALSLAFARASSLERAVPLYRYFAETIGRTANTMPRPTINLFSGGKHAGGQVPIQDVLVVPIGARSIDEALSMTYAVYQSAAKLTARKYGARALTADEGGLAPPFPSIAAMLDDAVESIRCAGFNPGTDVSLALDIASTHFYRAERYHLGMQPLDSTAMIVEITSWLDRYPIVSVEDGLAEDDWRHWPLLRQAVAGRALVLGDDLLCTNPQRIRRAIAANAADALLLKVNQIGTVSEAAEACGLAKVAQWQVTVSARSGETEDHWLADLAVGWGGDQIKVGSITQSERLAKYNRLLMIEAETGFHMPPWRTTRR